MNTIIEIIGLVGLTIIFTNGRITEKLRALAVKKNEIIGEFLECSLCVGFWVGFLYSFFFRDGDITISESLLCDFLYGGMISIISLLIDIKLEHLRLKNELLRWEKAQIETTGRSEDSLQGQDKSNTSK